MTKISISIPRDRLERMGLSSRDVSAKLKEFLITLSEIIGKMHERANIIYKLTEKIAEKTRRLYEKEISQVDLLEINEITTDASILIDLIKDAYITPSERNIISFLETENRALKRMIKYASTAETTSLIKSLLRSELISHVTLLINLVYGLLEEYSTLTQKLKSEVSGLKNLASKLKEIKSSKSLITHI